jgi:hypothetical protein
MNVSLLGNLPPRCCSLHSSAGAFRHAHRATSRLFSALVFPAMCGRYEIICLTQCSRDCEAAHDTPVFFKLQMFFQKIIKLFFQAVFLVPLSPSLQHRLSPCTEGFDSWQA